MVNFGGNLPGANRYSPESDWVGMGVLGTAVLTGRVARINSVPWAAWPEGFKGGQIDTNQIIRHMEVAQKTKQTIIILCPSEWTVSGAWIPPRDHWNAAVVAVKRMIKEYDAAAKRFNLAPPLYQLWNETSPGKPGGASDGTPGQFTPELHDYLSYITKGLGITSSTAKRFISPALSNLTDSQDAAFGELVSCSSTDGYWERRVGAIAIHVRLQGYGMNLEQYEAHVTEALNRYVDLVSALPYWRGKGLPVDVTECYVTPGDLGHNELGELDLESWRQAALRGAAKSKVRNFIVYGLQDSVIEGDGSPWFKYGGWGISLMNSNIEAYAKDFSAK